MLAMNVPHELPVLFRQFVQGWSYGREIWNESPIIATEAHKRSGLPETVQCSPVGDILDLDRIVRDSSLNNLITKEADFHSQKAAFQNLELESCTAKTLEEDIHSFQMGWKVSRVHCDII